MLVCIIRNSAGEMFTFDVFLSGDYEFLCYMYGLTGATGTITLYYFNYLLNTTMHVGRHRCLYCLINQDSLIIPREERRQQEDRVDLPRSLEGIQADHKRFLEEGKGNIKLAKQYNNVIGPHFWDVELSHVNKLHYGMVTTNT